MSDVYISAQELCTMSHWDVLERLDPQQWDWRAERDAETSGTARIYIIELTAADIVEATQLSLF